MIFFRYLTKEVLLTTLAVTLIFLLIFLSNQLVRYLAMSAAGQFPGIILFRLMALEVPKLLGLLLPLGCFLGIILAYGRLYADQEMTVMIASGLSMQRLIMITMVIATVIGLICAAMVMWLAPSIAAAKARLVKQEAKNVLIHSIAPQRFHRLNHGRLVVFANEVSAGEARGVFVASLDPKGNKWSVVTAKAATVQQEPQTQQRFVVMKDGSRYSGEPRQKNLQVIRFERYGMRLPTPQVDLNHETHAKSTASLFPVDNKNTVLAAELQWRISVPLSVWLLALLAIPLSRVKPRQGKYAKVLPAGLVYAVYANMLFVARDWVDNGTVPALIGMWWLHLLVLLLALALLWLQGRRLRLFRVAT